MSTRTRTTGRDTVVAVAMSQNAKTGLVAATYAPQQTCPGTCPHLRAGTCYAAFGHVGLHWRRITAAAGRWLRGSWRYGSRRALALADAEAEAIDALAVAVPGIPLRVHVAGDCATIAAARTVAAAVARWQSRGGGPAWAYTHAWRSTRPKHWAPISVLASVETAEEARAATARGWPLAWTVASHDAADLAVAEADGTRAVPCPEQTHGTPCNQCRLCYDAAGLAARGRSIAFAAHGTRAKALAARLRG